MATTSQKHGQRQTWSFYGAEEDVPYRPSRKKGNANLSALQQHLGSQGFSNFYNDAHTSDKKLYMDEISPSSKKVVLARNGSSPRPQSARELGNFTPDIPSPRSPSLRMVPQPNRKEKTSSKRIVHPTTESSREFTVTPRRHFTQSSIDNVRDLLTFQQPSTPK